MGSLDVRMKQYEYVTRNYLLRRTPVIIRIDGKAFHTFTRGFEKPYDLRLNEAMQRTMKYLCENVEGCVMGYTQSDEITLVLCDYKKITSQAWFNDNIQKMCSVSASLATLEFNRVFKEIVTAWQDKTFTSFEFDEHGAKDAEAFAKYQKLSNAYNSSICRGALFDSRAFNIPVEEVNNCLLWRQQDATRNSIESLAQVNFSHKSLQGLNTDALQEKLWSERGINWNNCPTAQKRGCCCIKENEYFEGDDTVGGKPYMRSKWVIDTEIPIFSKNPNYVNHRIIFEK